jgi:hypothetical protein
LSFLVLAGGCGSSSTPPDTAVPIDAAPGDAGPDAAVTRDVSPFERTPPTPAPAALPFQVKDVGDVGAMPGRLTFAGALVLRGGGRDIGGMSDSFGFAYAKLKGDGDFVARVRSVQAIDPTSTAGIMVRADESDPTAASLFVGVLADPARGGQTVFRAQKGAMAEASTPDPQVRNQFLRIRREGRRFTAFRSSDRWAWVKLGSFEADMPEELAYGLAVSARSTMAPTQGEFDFARLIALDGRAAAEQWDVEPLGIAGPAPVAVMAGDKVSITGVADVFTTTFENGAALLAPMSGSRTITAKVEALGTAGTPNARMALTFREGSATRLNPTSRNILISVNAAGVVQFQRRDRSTNFEPGAMKDGLKPPVWLRLSRYDDPVTGKTTVAGLYSADGAQWTKLDEAEFAIPDPAMTGLVFTPGTLTTYATGQASGFSVTTTVPPTSDGGAPDSGAQSP